MIRSPALTEQVLAIVVDRVIQAFRPIRPQAITL